MSPAEFERFMAKVRVLESGCWEWTGALTKPSLKQPSTGGYGLFTIGGKVRLTHRLAFEHFVGPIPEGRILDNVCHGRDLDTCPASSACRHRRCVNPEHLEPVTYSTNTRRGAGPAAENAFKVECLRGHPLSGENLHIDPSGRRICRECKRLENTSDRARARKAAWWRAKHGKGVLA